MKEFFGPLRVDPRQSTLPEKLDRLVLRYINCHKGTFFKVNQLLQHIEMTWEDVRSDEGYRTNNATSRLIGLDYKIRSKTMRWSKNINKVLGHCYLSEFQLCDKWVFYLRKVV